MARIKRRACGASEREASCRCVTSEAREEMQVVWRRKVFRKRTRRRMPASKMQGEMESEARAAAAAGIVKWARGALRGGVHVEGSGSLGGTRGGNAAPPCKEADEAQWKLA